jgi:hypothetical protein
MQSLLLGSKGVSGRDTEGADNLILNGDFQVAQQGVSFPSANGYTLDQWFFYNNSTARYTISQTADIPTVSQAGVHAGNSLTATCTTGVASFPADRAVQLYQNIKGSRFRKIAQKSFVLSFWVSSTRTGVYCVTFRNGVGDRLYIAEYTVNAANTWEKKTVVVPAAPTDGTWNYANGVGLTVLWSLAGTPATDAPNTWLTSGWGYTANQVNHSQVNNTFKLALVKIEPGIIATPFSLRDDELLLCQEYYYRGSLSQCFYASVAGEQLHTTIYLPTTMRAVPSAALVTAGYRDSISGASIEMFTAREGRFIITGSTAARFPIVQNDIWEFNARL